MKIFSKQSNRVSVPLILVLLTFISACNNEDEQGMQGVNSNNVPATIHFNSDGCPIDADINRNMVAQGTPGQKILFTSSPLKTGDKFNDFELTFDPFAGRTYKSTEGKYLSMPLARQSIPSRTNQNQTEYRYKFVINAEGCDPVDPMIIIDK